MAHTPPTKLSTLLSTNTPIILDGALATYLETLGADITGALWSASLLTTNPILIKKTHLDYYAAGAHIAITASYQASIPGLTEHFGISEEEAKALVRKSVELAREARDECIVGLLSERDGEGGEKVVKLKGKNLLVAGSVGPYGAYLADGSEYTGSYNLTDTAMKDFHRGRIAALISAGSDILALETIPSFAETRALLTLLATEFPSTEAWISFSLRSSFQISDGTPLQEVVRFVEQFPNIVVAVGANCVAVDVAVEAVKVLKGYTRLPVVVYPNSGEVWNAEARGWKGERSDGEKLVERTREFWEAGARIIGGCCRTTPGDVEVIAETLRGVE